MLFLCVSCFDCSIDFKYLGMRFLHLFCGALFFLPGDWFAETCVDSLSFLFSLSGVKLFFFVLFIIWGIPLGYYRSRFRKIVYRTDSFWINFAPYFWKELKALFGNLYPLNFSYLKMRNFYRRYLVIYTFLFLAYLFFA